MSALVSIIMRTKNRPLMLNRAVRDVLIQRYQEWELIIINDGGNESEVNEVIEDNVKNNEKVIVVHNSISKGMEACSNIGIKHSSGKYIVLHDDDDTWNEMFLEKTISEIENCKIPTVGGIACRTKIIYEKIKKGTIVKVKEKSFNKNFDSVTLASICCANQFTVNAFLYKRDVIENIGSYREDLPVLGDWDFNIRFLSQYDVMVIPIEYANYHIRMSNAISDKYTNTHRRDHVFFESVIRNSYLRNDICNQRIGLGFLLAVGSETGSIKVMLRLLRALERIFKLQ